MRRSRLTLVLAFLAVGACNSPLSPGDERALEMAERLWTAKRPASYTYEVRMSCFCAPGMASWTEVLVRGDSIVSSRVIEVARGGEQPVPLEFWPTVPRLFTIIRRAADEDYTKALTAEYEPQLGYPLRIGIVCKDNIADCGVVYESRNLKPAP